MNTIDLTPTWCAAARIYVMALENGTEEGKQVAREGILEMAQHLDHTNAERKASVGSQINWKGSYFEARAQIEELTKQRDALLAAGRRSLS